MAAFYLVTVLVLYTSAFTQSSWAYLNTVCTTNTSVSCIPEVNELSFACCAESEVGNNDACSGWCSSDTISNTKKSPSTDYLLKNAPGVSTNVGCLVDFSYITAWKHNKTVLSTDDLPKEYPFT